MAEQRPSTDTAKRNQVALETALFADLVGADFVDLIFEIAPGKVKSRVSKALDHFHKAIGLEGLDDEMGAIRLIAAEEELVVAIFEWLKLSADKMPEHKDFVRQYKNHRVKLVFHPVLSQLRFVLEDLLSHGMTMDGLEDLINWTVKPIVQDKKVLLQIIDEKGKKIINHNPLAVAISWDDKSADEVLDELFKDFAKLVRERQGMTIREFVSARADYRNKIFYAEDGGFSEMKEDLKSLIEIFKLTYRDLLWTLAVLLSNDPLKTGGLVNQFIALYRRVLIESKLL